MTDVVLLNSGGLDSRVTAAMLVASGMAVHSVYNDWSGIAAQERAAEQTAAAYCVSHEVFRWPSPGWVIFDEHLRKRCLPHTTFHTAMLGAVRAVSLGIRWVASGARRESAGDGFREAFQSLLNESKFYPDKVLLLPVWEMTNDEVTERGRLLGVDLDSTWSCPNADPHCRSCESCLRRIRQEIAL